MTKREIRENLTGYAFLIPWFIGILVFTAFPFIYSMYLSFTDYNFVKEMQFIGLDNWKRMFSIKPTGFDFKAFMKSDLYMSIKATFTYSFVSVPVRMILAMSAALALNRKARGVGVYRTIFYMPSFIGGSIGMAVMWKLILTDRGFVNAMLNIFGLGPVSFLSSPRNAVFTLAGISMYTLGSTMLIFLAGLQEVPTDLYESATIDGAGRWSQFIKITLPMVSPVILYNVIMSIIGSLQVFSSAFVITKGGPIKSTYFFALYLYEEAFKYFRMGYASALAWFIFFVIMIFTLIMLRVSGGLVFYESDISRAKKDIKDEIRNRKRRLKRRGAAA